jgi:4-alpha-glucanotransferase
VTLTPALEHLLSLVGIADHYIDYGGNRVTIPLDNRLAILARLGIIATDEASISEALQAEQQRRYGRLVASAVTASADHAPQILVNFPTPVPGASLLWHIDREDGVRHSGQCHGDELPVVGTQAVGSHFVTTRQLQLPALPAGYHRLTLNWGTEQGECRLICAPQHCHQPGWLAQQRRLAGLSVQLYSLRSSRNWGLGDFTDLDGLLRQAAAAGVDFVVLNPLHVLDSRAPEQCSPYSPLDRRYLNPLYIDVEREPDFQDCPGARDFVARPAFQARLAELRDGPLVDYASVTRLKLVALSKMFKHFRRQHLDGDSPRGQDFRQWVLLKGQPLQAFADFEAHRHRLSLDQSRHPEFHCYLQWLAEGQLATSQQLARQAGMAVGLVRDLAVGGNPSSAEVQLNPDLFCRGASIGAPPDPLAPQGQNWGLPPMDPRVLENSGFAHVIELVRDNMSHCGGLRIDHVMSLLRLWWCPEPDPGSTTEPVGSAAGAYVFYPVETLFAILRLESQRRRCLVIGEDLGVVPPEIRQHMSQSAVFSNVLFYFEKYDPVHFKKPEHYPPRALAMVANHDVPTLAAWWNKSDLALRRQIGLLDDEQGFGEAVRQRESDLIQILHWLDGQGDLTGHWRDFNIHRPFDHELCAALLRATGRSASLLVSIQLEDLTLTLMPVNIPGTFDEYPNWRRKLDGDLDGLFADARAMELLTTFVSARQH